MFWSIVIEEFLQFFKMMFLLILVPQTKREDPLLDIKIFETTSNAQKITADSTCGRNPQFRVPDLNQVNTFHSAISSQSEHSPFLL